MLAKLVENIQQTMISLEIDGERYTIRSVESQDDGIIIIEGYA